MCMIDCMFIYLNSVICMSPQAEQSKSPLLSHWSRATPLLSSSPSLPSWTSRHVPAQHRWCGSFRFESLPSCRFTTDLPHEMHVIVGMCTSLCFFIIHHIFTKSLSHAECHEFMKTQMANFWAAELRTASTRPPAQAYLKPSIWLDSRSTAHNQWECAHGLSMTIYKLIKCIPGSWHTNILKATNIPTCSHRATILSPDTFAIHDSGVENAQCLLSIRRFIQSTADGFRRPRSVHVYNLQNY